MTLWVYGGGGDLKISELMVRETHWEALRGHFTAQEKLHLQQNNGHDLIENCATAKLRRPIRR
jgi:hypothetical protein